jgi:hypothetical protein
MQQPHYHASVTTSSTICLHIGHPLPSPYAPAQAQVHQVTMQQTNLANTLVILLQRKQPANHKLCLAPDNATVRCR